MTYTYNGEGQLYSVNETGGDAPATYLYTYDSTGNLVASEKKNANGSTAMRVYQDYDAAGQLVGQTWCLGSSSYSESYTYNPSNGTLSSMVTGMGQTLQLGYDELQRLTSVGNGLYTKNYSYRNISDTRTTTQVSQVQYTGLSTDISYGYTYDAVGNIATYSAPGKSTVTYTYDALGQLLSAVGDETYTYTYDSAGNVLTANGHTYTYGAPGWPDLLSGYDGETIVFDRIGNPLSYYNGTRWTFTWKNGRSLATATDGDTNLSFGYDANGLRTSKTVDGVTHKYYYASGQLMRETYGNRTLDFFYDAGGYPYGLKTNERFFLYITNLQGDVTHLINVAGNIVASYEYDPYGNIVSATGTMADINPLRYRGYYYDTELEMYYLQSRYYDPQIGRFLNMDAYASTGQGVIGFNMFAYCNNNPINRLDTAGSASYTNSTTAKEDGSYTVKTVIKILWTKLTFNYTITKKGIVHFSFITNNYWSVLWRGAEKTLAEAIYHAAKSINTNFLWGRTIGGLSIELKLHYIAYTLGIKRSSSEAADMGGTSKRKTGFDSNAWFFEGTNAARIITDYNIRDPWDMYKAVRSIARYF